MKPISVVISSLRADELEKTIDSTAMHADLIDVVVVSPTPPRPRSFVRHTPVPVVTGGTPYEREQRGELSLSQKMNLGLKHADGEYIAFNNDNLHFRPGWAPAMLEHMERHGRRSRPYLAAFHLSNGGVISARHTIFGLLYANQACISRADLKLVGDYLYDERMRTEYVDPDLSLRVWAAGGEVGICPEVVIDIDRYVEVRQPQTPGSKQPLDPLCVPYKVFWSTPDSAAFFDLWFRKYCWLFWRHYRQLASKFTTDDGVLPEGRENSSAVGVFWRPLVKLGVFGLLGVADRRDQAKWQLCRLMNRRWATLEYEVPFDLLALRRRLPGLSLDHA